MQVSVDTLCRTTTTLALAPAQLVRAVSSLVTWLGITPFQHLQQHTLAICSRVAVFHPDIVRRVAEDCVPALTKKLAIPLLRPQLEPVFLHLVYANQDR